ncbi:glycoside hydrolase family 98 domain-containing protein [Kitasatospora xanthocidica]|uniref:glycoside hydrolase family 98 domain-containing protein n=1 Tax=Kitasatospora xanthocidica TaxID=83382 RepID=UPI0036F0A431
MVRKLLARLLAVAVICAVLPLLGQAAPAQAAALRRAISETNPMFVLTVANNQPQSTVQNIVNTVPADLKPYVVVSLYYEPITDSAARSWFDAQLTIADQLGVKANAQIANGWTGTSIDRAFVESMYQNHPSFIGPLFAELYGTNYGMVADMLNLSAQYGGYVFNVEYTNGSNGMLSAHSSPVMLAAMRAHPDNYIPIAKQTTMSRYHETEAIANGLWTSGLAGNWGVNPDTWTWWETGRAGLFASEPGHRGADGWKALTTYPEAQLSEVMLQSALAGATVFANFEHYSYTHFNNGATTPAFVKEIIPTMREIVGKGLIPTRAAVRSKIKVAFLSDNDQINNDYYSDLYADGTNIDWLRTSGRYYIIPLLVGGTNATERGYFPEVISTSQYASLFPTVAAKLSYFNSRYAPDALGSATAQNFLIDKWLILNNLENTNRLQNTLAYPRVATVDTFGMTMPPNTYAIVDEDANALKFRISNYNVNKASIWSQGTWGNTEFQNWIRNVYQVSPDESDTRTTVIQVNGHTGGSKPAISITGYNGYNGYTYADSWDSVNKTYRLSITHNGPIDVTINAWGDNSAHSRPTDSSPIVIEGEAAAFSGASRAMANSAASGGQVAGFIGNSAADFASYTVTAPSAGLYNAVLTTLHDGTRGVSVSANGAAAQTLSIQGNGWSSPVTTGFSLQLQAGTNTVKIFNNTAYAPDIDSITVTAAGSAVGQIKTALNAGKCVDVNGAINTDGTRVQIWDCNTTAAQQWTMPGDGTIRAMGKCLDVTGGATANSTPIQLWHCIVSGAQIWQPRPDGTLLNPQSGRCLGLPASNTVNGTQLVIYDCSGSADQRWTPSA